MELGLEVGGHVQIWICFPLTPNISATITLVRVRVRVYGTTELCTLLDAHLHKGLHVLGYRMETKLQIAQTAHFR